MVTIDIRIINQSGKTVQSGSWLVLVASKPAQA
jgi:hypothetical protein